MSALETCSYWILWNKPTLTASRKDYMCRFKLKKFCKKTWVPTTYDINKEVMMTYDIINYFSIEN
jgi:hypothetical protein